MFLFPSGAGHSSVGSKKKNEASVAFFQLCCYFKPNLKAKEVSPGLALLEEKANKNNKIIK